MARVLIFDTTLRDGEQSPGCTLNVEEKLEVAHGLGRMGVDIIEGGFPIASVGDFESVRLMAEQIRDVQICALARAIPADVDRAAEAIKNAANGRIHVFISSSDIHLIHQMRKGRSEVLDQARMMVRRARNFTDNVEFSPMDATRSNPDYLVGILEAAVEEGATTLNIPDTVGYATPNEYFALIQKIMNEVRGIERCIISTHTHNDLGLAVANALAGVQAGARQIECTINGIGERAGNASLEEVVMAIKTRESYFKMTTGIDTTKIYQMSNLVSRLTGSTVQPNKAIVGRNAFRHESGIHQDGILKERSTYEIMDARDIGWPSSQLVLGKHSGRHALEERLKALGQQVDEETLNRVFTEFKDLADAQKEVSDSDILALVGIGSIVSDTDWSIHELNYSSGSQLRHAAVTLTKEGENYTATGHGNGPIAAAFDAIDHIVASGGPHHTLVDFGIQAVGDGPTATGEATVSIKSADDGQVFTGRSSASDIVVAGAQAYINAMNQLVKNRSAAFVAVG